MGIRAKRLGVMMPLFAVCGAGGWLWIDFNNENGNWTSRRGLFWPRVSGDLLSLQSSGARTPKAKAKRLGVLIFVFGVWGQGNEFELIPTIKMETRHPVEIYYSCEYASICHHCGVMAAWSRQNRNIGIFSRHFLRLKKTTPYDKIFKILFVKFTSRHWSTLLCAKFVKIVRREIGESVRYLPDRKPKKISAFRKLWLLRGSRPKSAMASPEHLADNFPNFIHIGSLSVEL